MSKKKNRKLHGVKTWKIYKLTTDANVDIGLTASPQSRFRISKKGDTLHFKEKRNVRWGSDGKFEADLEPLPASHPNRAAGYSHVIEGIRIDGEGGVHNAYFGVFRDPDDPDPERGKRILMVEVRSQEFGGETGGNGRGQR